MSMGTFPALIALLPAMVGPLPLEQGAGRIMLALCGGGAVAIQLAGGDAPMPGPAMTPCCAKGCRNSEKRRATNGDN
ncbi:hypothetical protein [Alteraurantiacibacter palmitatis]|uniref:Uncharacterized protein n=1 Tax=Alteraurantiacibacter palmitatis TaxID=2054628 RepID=A0ABV7E0Q7_9SPHN